LASIVSYSKPLFSMVSNYALTTKHTKVTKNLEINTFTF
jgi:hypothetical protein